MSDELERTPAIAIVGVSCRLPKAASPDAFWRLLRDGASGITPAPGDRWEATDVPGPSGGFLEGVDLFDAAFFGITPHEAAAIDPQQRLLLELAWEALEHAGILPGDLSGSRTGVYVGAMAQDYATLTHRCGPDATTPHTMAGLGRAIIANRVSYVLGLVGPSLSIDTAQSSSLVAVDLACRDLRGGLAELAIVGGVHLNLAPHGVAEAAVLGALSPDGQCFTFDARANGFARGEGGAAMVLKTVDRALADGDPIIAVIRGSAVNNDGATPTLTTPSQRAQAAVIRAACENACVEPSAVQYVELHGTGTVVGDPVEAAALGAALGSARGHEALAVGSVKTNIGHLEGAAGIAGLLKTALAIHHRQLPASLNFRSPNPDIPLDDLRLRVQAETAPWPRPDAPLVAGVSAFGMGGANCHVVLAEPPEPRRPSPAVTPLRRPMPWLVSAREEPALRAYAARLADHVTGADSADVGHALATTRTTFEHRAVVIAADHEQGLGGLRALAKGGPAPNLVCGTAGDVGHAVAVFPGQGSQWAGMAVSLLRESRVFRDRIQECAAAIDPLVDWSLLEILQDAQGSGLDRVDIVQPALFAVMVSLAELWRSFGVRFDAVLGHSQGEIAAACVAGALSLEDAARVACVRARLLTTLAGRGGMASVALSSAETARRLEPFAGRLCVAAVNGPATTVVSGEDRALERFLSDCRASDILARRIAVDYASHSTQIEQVREPLLEGLAGICPRASTIAFWSTVSATPIDTTTLDADYWYRNLRQRVEFEGAVRALAGAGHGAFIEASPHPVLTASVHAILDAVVAHDDATAARVVAGTLRRDDGGWARVLTSVAQAHVDGVAVDWQPAVADGGRIALPTYPFQRRRHWLAAARPHGDRTDRGPVGDVPVSLADRLADRGAGEQERALLDVVRTSVAAVLGSAEPSAVSVQRTFRDLGLDSVTVVELLGRLAAATGLRLPPTLAFEHPTPGSLARHLRALMFAPDSTPSVPAAAAASADELVAIVGMACRYPGGVRSPEDLWRLVADGRDAIAGFPDDRGWDLDALFDPDPDRPGTSYAREGGFLRDADQFDAAFFDISPREALAMDPQQRVLLETSWEAFERAGIDPLTLRGTEAGVFVGAMAQDYGPRLHEADAELGGRLLTGTSTSVISGRIAYTFGLQGPAVTIDTACSSSLVALHHACRALRAGECTLALAGGATVMSTPGLFVEFSRQRALAADGRCKAFAEAADGTGWAEGAGLVVLERLSDALAAGHPVLAVVRGSAVNHDGASNGLTAPNGAAQARVIRRALAGAGLSAADVDALEAHGTGTRLGDPIEAQALLDTYGRGRETPAWLGSLKSNIGHTQAAAGVAGVIKMVMGLRHGRLPKTLHVDAPSSHVDWSTGAVELLTEPRAWPETGRPRRAAVSSFGVSGTNCHLILEQASIDVASGPTDAAPIVDGPLTLVPLSARSEPALRAHVTGLRDHLAARPDLPVPVVAHALATRRAQLDRRAVLLVEDGDELLQGLDAIATGDPTRLVVRGRAATDSGTTAFVFSGQGQWVGMGRRLYEASPLFAAAFDQACACIDPQLDQPLAEVVFAAPGSPAAALLDQTAYAQPALFALQTALARLLERVGVRADYVAGHSIGEVAAAHVAGALSLEDAGRLAAVRGRLMQDLPAGGAMALDELRRVAGQPATGPDRVPFVSSLSGLPVGAEQLGDPEYWVRQAGGSVRFHQAIRWLRDQGVNAIVELGPHGSLAAAIERSLESDERSAGLRPLITGTLERERDDVRALLGSLAELWAHGQSIDWSALAAGGSPIVDLPTYPFQRRRYWLNGPTNATTAAAEPSGDAGQLDVLRERVAGLAPDDRLRHLVRLVRAHAATLLGHDGPDAVDPDSAFKELGFDSLAAVRLRTQLVAATGLSLPAAIVFDHPTPRALAGQLRDLLSGEGGTAVAVIPRAATVDEPVAIVGLACRLPGDVRSADDLWQLVSRGTDAITAFPTDRGWDLDALANGDPEAPGSSIARMGGFLRDAAGFDAAFFGISPREALAMDPHQRLLLELAWEGLEHAGIDPSGLSGHDAGVFVGVYSTGHEVKLRASDLAHDHLGTGAAASVVSGRIAYALGLQGPAMSIDTACSSSLVAIHQACHALRGGECSLALAGGATVNSTPALFVDFARQRALAPDGRCKAFAAAADGTGLAEGGGLLVLERLSDAERHGHRVLALVRGSAVNQDGASNGLTAPNGPSQERVILNALASAGLTPADVDAVEAHGTGTALGDPIEAHALLATYGRDRSQDEPLWLGSLKSNIGHPQAAAGVAGVMKMVLALRHGQLPRTLHVGEASREIDWSAGAVRLLTEQRPWPEHDRPRRCGVSSFGISGTNAHLILEQAPAVAATVPDGTPALDTTPTPILLSAKSEAALRAHAARLRRQLDDRPDVAPADVGRTLALGRAHLAHRAALIAADGDQLRAGLDALARDRPSPAIVLGAATAVDDPGKTAFVFPGQGGQHAGMAGRLYQTSAVFRTHIHACADALAPHVDWSLTDVLSDPDDVRWLDRVEVVQPALWAVMVALARLWQALGVRPDAVVGHSQGEVAAAHIAGALTLDDAARVVAVRARMLTALAGKGGLVSIALAADALADRPPLRTGDLTIAAVNGPEMTVVAGEPRALDELLADCQAAGIRGRRIAIDYAAHSPQVDSLRDRLLQALDGLEPRPTDVPLYSTVSGQAVAGGDLTADYWVRNMRQTVQFQPAVQALVEDGHHTFIEVSPHPVLTPPVERTLHATGVAQSLITGTLRRDRDDTEQILAVAARLHARGHRVDWPAVFDGRGGRQIDLPSYPFEHEPYWLNATPAAGDVTTAGLDRPDHPLLDAAVDLPDGGIVLVGRLSIRGAHAWLADHALAGTPTLPGAALLELALHAAGLSDCDRVQSLTLHTPLPLSEHADVRLRVAVGPLVDGRRSIAVHSRSDPHAAAERNGRSWTELATGTLAAADGSSEPVPARTGAWPPPGATRMDGAELYLRLADRGYDYGPAFQGLRGVWRGADGVAAEVALPADLAAAAASFSAHPALLDAALQSVLPLLFDGPDPEPQRGRWIWAPFSFADVSVQRAGAAAARVRVVADGPDHLEVALFDEHDRCLASIGSLVVRPLPTEQLGDRQLLHDALFRVAWRPLPSNEPAGDRAGTRFAVLGDGAVAAAVARALQADARDVAGHADLAALRAAIDAGEPVPELVLQPLPADAAHDLLAAAHDATARALDLVRRWLDDERLARCRLALVTCNAIGAGDLAGAAVWGLIRSVQSEHPGRFVLVDVDGSEASLHALAAALAGGEGQVAIRDGLLSVPRLARAGDDALTPPEGELAWRLAVSDGAAGGLDDLALAACPDVCGPLGSGQVRVGVRAAGLNFRDVLNALGVVRLPFPLGAEAAGVVLEVGPDVPDLVAGDRVMGLAWGSMGPLVVADHRLLVGVPEGWSFAQAAGVPVAFLTAWQSLVDCARLGAGESVLVHAATGGVGMAAVQIARLRGAEVFATAHPEKWETLRGMGIAEDHIASSRTGEFERRFREVTGGRGVDVVLHCLAGELTDASLRLLAGGGRLVDIGKTDIRDAGRIAHEHPGATYHAYDVADTELDRLGNGLEQLHDLFCAGSLHSLPIVTSPLGCAVDAFRVMSNGRHTGKLVFTLPRSLDPEGTVLITGGTGALGALTARHLAGHHDVRRLLLVSRRGPAAPGADDLVAELEALGASVTVAACDVADAAAVDDLLAAVSPAHPLTAVVHAAGILDDASIADLTQEQLHAVLEPKLDAAWNLHRATRDHDVAAFVLFSSVAGLLGTPGQGSYTAANSFLDALAQHRRAKGQPAVSIAWGMWEQTTGMTEELGTAGIRRVMRAGLAPISVRQGLAALDAILDATGDGERPLVVPASFDLTSVRAQGTTPLLSELVESAAPSTPPARLSHGSQPLPAAAHHGSPLDLVTAAAAAVLDHPSPDEIDPDARLTDLGLDSLTAVELRNRLTTATGHPLPATIAFDHPTPRELATHLSSRIAAVGESNGGRTARPARAGQSLGSLFKRAVARDQAVDGLHLLTAAAGLRPTFARALPAHARPNPRQLCEGRRRPALICLDPFMPADIAYARLAAAFDGERDLSVLSLPGYREDEELPATVDVLAETLAAAVEQHVAGRPFVLGGHSSGGWVAHAVAHRLAADDVHPRAVVAIDTPPPTHTSRAVFSAVLRGLSESQAEFLSLDDGPLTALGWYFELFHRHWSPQSLAVPILCVQAERGFPRVAHDDWVDQWPGRATAVTTPGDHFTMLTEHAAQVAEAIDAFFDAADR